MIFPVNEVSGTFTVLVSLPVAPVIAVTSKLAGSVTITSVPSVLTVSVSSAFPPLMSAMTRLPEPSIVSPVSATVPLN